MHFPLSLLNSDTVIKLEFGGWTWHYSAKLFSEPPDASPDLCTVAPKLSARWPAQLSWSTRRGSRGLQM